MLETCAICEHTIYIDDRTAKVDGELCHLICAWDEVDDPAPNSDFGDS